MHDSQFYFSLATGISIIVLGAALASAGIVDWGLFAVGCGISGLAMASRVGNRIKHVARTVTARRFNSISSSRQAQ
jgi:hypothetical protein